MPKSDKQNAADSMSKSPILEALRKGRHDIDVYDLIHNSEYSNDIWMQWYQRRFVFAEMNPVQEFTFRAKKWLQQVTVSDANSNNEKSESNYPLSRRQSREKPDETIPDWKKSYIKRLVKTYDTGQALSGFVVSLINTYVKGSSSLYQNIRRSLPPNYKRDWREFMTAEQAAMLLLIGQESSANEFQLEDLEVLLNFSDPNLNISHLSLLHQACCYYDVEKVKLLLEFGANPNCVVDFEWNYSLLSALIRGFPSTNIYHPSRLSRNEGLARRTAIMTLLLLNGASPYTTDNFGMSAFHWLSSHLSHTWMSLCLLGGMDPEHPRISQGTMCSHIALDSRSASPAVLDTTRLLVKYNVAGSGILESRGLTDLELGIHDKACEESIGLLIKFWAAKPPRHRPSQEQLMSHLSNNKKRVNFSKLFELAENNVNDAEDEAKRTDDDASDQSELRTIERN